MTKYSCQEFFSSVVYEVMIPGGVPLCPEIDMLESI